MFVIKLKDILKAFIRVIIIFAVTFILLKSIKNVKFDFSINHNFFNESFVLSEYDNKKKSTKISGIKKILSSELAIFSLENEIRTQEILEEAIGKIVEETKIENKTEFVPLENSLATSVIETNNKIDTYTNIFERVKIKNESVYDLEKELLNVDYSIKNKKDIIIYHTHTCESYTATDENNYQQTGNYRTTDLNFSVAKVGDELEYNLTNLGFNVLHDKTYHDYPAYTGSYTRGLTTISKLLTDNDAELVIDLHRDALGDLSSYAPTVQIGDEVVAQVMFVIGTDGGDLEHPNWKNNLISAIKIQEKAEEMYPGFFKPIIVRNSRYNQHVTDGACIIEVGATGNTLEQCLGSMKYLANVINESLK